MIGNIRIRNVSRRCAGSSPPNSTRNHRSKSTRGGSNFTSPIGYATTEPPHHRNALILMLESASKVCEMVIYRGNAVERGGAGVQNFRGYLDCFQDRRRCAIGLTSLHHPLHLRRRQRWGGGRADVVFIVWEGDFCLSSRLRDEGKGSEGQLVGAGHQFLLYRRQRPVLDRNPVFSGGGIGDFLKGRVRSTIGQGFPVARRDC